MDEILALSFTSCVTLSKYHDLLSKPQFPHLRNGDNTDTSCIVRHIKCLEKYLAHGKMFNVISIFFHLVLPPHFIAEESILSAYCIRSYNKLVAFLKLTPGFLDRMEKRKTEKRYNIKAI